MMLLKDQVCLITGASKGIGRSIAEEYAKQGAIVYVNARVENSIDEWAANLADTYHTKVTPVYFDITDLAAAKKQVMQIKSVEKRIDVLVNNAGGLGGRSRFEEMTTEFYRFVMALNLDSVFFASRAAIPFLKKGDNATIINYTSNAGWNAGGPGAGIYGTSKAGVHTITRALAKDLAEYGIRVNAVSPGTIDTPFHAQIKSTKPEVFASWANNIMLGRLGKPEDVAGVVSFLASKDAAFLTAETIQVGGGQALGI